MSQKTVKIINLKIATKSASARIREMARQEYLDGSTIYGTSKKLHVTALTVFNWFKRFRKNQGEQFTEHKRGPSFGKVGLLDSKQQKQLAKVLTDKTPGQLKFDFALWSSRAIKEYVKDVLQSDMCRTIMSALIRETALPGGFGKIRPSAVGMPERESAGKAPATRHSTDQGVWKLRARSPAIIRRPLRRSPGCAAP